MHRECNYEEQEQVRANQKPQKQIREEKKQEPRKTKP